MTLETLAKLVGEMRRQRGGASDVEVARALATAALEEADSRMHADSTDTDLWSGLSAARLRIREIIDSLQEKKS